MRKPMNKARKFVQEIQERSELVDKETNTLLKYIDTVGHLVPIGVMNKMKNHLHTIKHHNREIK